MNARDSLMVLAELAQSTVHAAPSPCISVCRMDDASGLCQGCYRTIEEIIAWGRQGDQAHRLVWQQLVRRAALVATPQSTTAEGP